MGHVIRIFRKKHKIKVEDKFSDSELKKKLLPWLETYFIDVKMSYLLIGVTSIPCVYLLFNYLYYKLDHPKKSLQRKTDMKKPPKEHFMYYNSIWKDYPELMYDMYNNSANTTTYDVNYSDVDAATSYSINQKNKSLNVKSYDEGSSASNDDVVLEQNDMNSSMSDCTGDIIKYHSKPTCYTSQTTFEGTSSFKYDSKQEGNNKEEEHTLEPATDNKVLVDQNEVTEIVKG